MVCSPTLRFRIVFSGSKKSCVGILLYNGSYFLLSGSLVGFCLNQLQGFEHLQVEDVLHKTLLFFEVSHDFGRVSFRSIARPNHRCCGASIDHAKLPKHRCHHEDKLRHHVKGTYCLQYNFNIY